MIIYERNRGLLLISLLQNSFISVESIRSATTTSGHAFTKLSVRRLECRTRSKYAKASNRLNMSRKVRR